MKMPTLILLLLIIAAVATFSVQNAAPVAVSFIFWHFDASLAIIVFLVLLCGVVAGASITSLLRIMKYFRNPAGGGEDR